MLAAVLFLVGAYQSPPPAQSTGDQLRALIQDGLDALDAPVEYQLVYTSTHIPGDSPEYERFSQILLNQEYQNRVYASLKAALDEVRSAQRVSPPTSAANSNAIYVGEATNYIVKQNHRMTYQELKDDSGALPIILRSPEVAALYRPRADILEFVDSSTPLDLRTPRDLLSPVPLGSIAQDYWFQQKIVSDTTVGDKEHVTILFDGSITLGLKYYNEPPHLIACAWIRAKESPPITRLAVFIQYASVYGAIRPVDILSIRQAQQVLTIYEYRLEDIKSCPVDSAFQLCITPETSIRSTTEGRLRRWDSIEALPVAWQALVRLR